MRLALNSLNIADWSELEQVEEKLTKKKALELYERGVIDTFEVGTFKGLTDIHKFLFENIYEFAGKVRSENIVKGHFCFASAMYLTEVLKSVSAMLQSNFDGIVGKYVEMNIARPFREGNGRSMSIWLDAILRKELSLAVNWNLISKDDYMLAMERSPIKDTELRLLLKNALTDRVNDREVYMKGIDMSYAYEDYTAYKVEEL